jgi:hypothetical protein
MSLDATDRRREHQRRLEDELALYGCSLPPVLGWSP